MVAQVEALGAGLALDGESATQLDIAGAVENVFGDPSYRESAQRLASLIASAPGAANAASRLEVLAGRHSPGPPRRTRIPPGR